MDFPWISQGDFANKKSQASGANEVPSSLQCPLTPAEAAGILDGEIMLPGLVN